MFLGSFIIAYAVVRLFYTQSITSEFQKKQIFEFNLSADIEATEVGPKDSFSVAPTIENTAMEDMYVFIEVLIPEINDKSIYEYEVNENWTLIEKLHGSCVYGVGVLTVLHPGETTDALTSKIAMKNITNAEYAEIDDINLTINGFGIDTKGEISDMTGVWSQCKALGKSGQKRGENTCAIFFYDIRFSNP